MRRHWLHLTLAAALALGGHAGLLLAAERIAPARSPVRPVYEIPQAHLAAPLTRLLKGMPLPADPRARAMILVLQNTDLSKNSELRKAAPLLYQLKHSLDYDLTPAPAGDEGQWEADGREHLALAAEEAAKDLEEKAIQLSAQAKALAMTRSGFYSEKRQELRDLAAQLGEIHKYYLKFLPEDPENQANNPRQLVEASLVEALAKLGLPGGGLDLPQEALRTEAVTTPSAAIAPRRAVRVGTARGYEELADLKNNPTGRRPDDLETLFREFGFKPRPRGAGGDHLVYTHPDFPRLTYAIPQHNKDLAPVHVRNAVKLIAELERLSAPQNVAPLPPAKAHRLPADYPITGEGSLASPKAPPETVAAEKVSAPLSPPAAESVARPPPARKKAPKPTPPPDAAVLAPPQERPAQTEAPPPAPRPREKPQNISLFEWLMRRLGLKRS